MIVVSTDVVAALYLPGENTGTAEAVLKRDPAWASPMLWRTLLPHYVTEPLARARSPRNSSASCWRKQKNCFSAGSFPLLPKENMRFVFQSQCSAFIAPFSRIGKGAASASRYLGFGSGARLSRDCHLGLRFRPRPFSYKTTLI